MISTHIKEIEESISSSSIVISSDIQNFFSSKSREAYIKGNLIFIDLSSLGFSVYVLEEDNKLVFDKYRYQYMDSRKKFVFRYDNAPHHNDISTFPLHKHLRDGKVEESTVPEFCEILDEISAFIARSLL